MQVQIILSLQLGDAKSITQSVILNIEKNEREESRCG